MENPSVTDVEVKKQEPQVIMEVLVQLYDNGELRTTVPTGGNLPNINIMAFGLLSTAMGVLTKGLYINAPAPSV